MNEFRLQQLDAWSKIIARDKIEIGDLISIRFSDGPGSTLIVPAIYAGRGLICKPSPIRITLGDDGYEVHTFFMEGGYRDWGVNSICYNGVVSRVKDAV